MTLRKLCLLLFATAPEKGSFMAFLTVRKIFFSAFRAQYRSRTKKRRKCSILCLLVWFLFFLRCGFRPEIRRKTTISCGFSLELIAGFEPATSSLPRTCSTSWAISAYSIYSTLLWRHRPRSHRLLFLTKDVLYLLSHISKWSFCLFCGISARYSLAKILLFPLSNISLLQFTNNAYLVYSNTTVKSSILFPFRKNNQKIFQPPWSNLYVFHNLKIVCMHILMTWNDWSLPAAVVQDTLSPILPSCKNWYIPTKLPTWGQTALNKI